ncbi:MAG: DNA polymerase [Deltaproteobacteria bacterium]|nr:DNA polymerase [Deltaproteobacteria bacterium]
MDVKEALAQLKLGNFKVDKYDDNCACFFHDLKGFYRKSGVWFENCLDLSICQLLIDPDLKRVRKMQHAEEIVSLLEKILEFELSRVSDLENRLTYVIGLMEGRGVKLDLKKLDRLNRLLLERIDNVESEIKNLTGRSLNLNSPKQVEKLLFEELKLPTSGIRKTKTGLSTDADTLAYLSQFNDVAKRLSDYRLYQKLLTGFVRPLLTKSDARGIVYPRINQLGTATGRVTYVNPNLQNVPAKDDLGKLIRECVIASEGRVFIRADYSQIELRVLAHLSNDSYLVDAFRNDKDIHKETARLIFDLESVDQVTTETRAVGKIINYSILYGMTAFGLAKSLKVSESEAGLLLKNFFQKLLGVNSYFENQIRTANQLGYVRSLLGRIRRVDKFKKGERERIIKNSPIQASSADIIKLAMINIQKKLKQLNIDNDVFIQLQVHDELLVNAPSELCDEVSRIVKHEMENVITLRVPLIVEVGIGESWKAAMR